MNNDNDSLKKAFNSKLVLELSNDFDSQFFQKLKNQKKPVVHKLCFFEYLSSFTGLALCAFACFLMIEQFSYSPEEDYLNTILTLEETLDSEIFTLEPTILTSVNLNEI